MANRPADSQHDARRILLEFPDEWVGERVLARSYRPGDGAALWDAVEESREHLRPWMPWTDLHRAPEDSESYARRSHARWLLREDFAISVWERETGRLVGGSGIHPYDWSVPSFEIGYWLRLSATGNGYMTETVRILCRVAFEQLGANRVFIRCDSENARSAAIPRRLGFVHEATVRCDGRTPEGALRDTLTFGLTAEDYNLLKEAG